MEHYNLLIVEYKSPGLRIIKTEAYKDLICNDLGLVHKNYGDFYSPVYVSRLPYVISRSLDQSLLEVKLDQDLVVVDSLKFNQETVDMEKLYIIKEPDGVRIYEPKSHTPDARDIDLSYELLGVMFIESLFAKKKKGSLQTSLEKQLFDFDKLEKRLK